jgi:pilus assembly protein CpaE
MFLQATGMADKKLDKLLAEAQAAYKKKDKRKGDKLVGEILSADFNHLGAWQLLHRVYGGKRSFGEFQRFFTLQYYPDKLYLLNKPDKNAESLTGAAPQKKVSFWRRLFGGGKGSPAATSASSTTAAQPFVDAGQASTSGKDSAVGSTKAGAAMPIGTPSIEQSPSQFLFSGSMRPGETGTEFAPSKLAPPEPAPPKTGDSYPFLPTTSPYATTGGRIEAPISGVALGPTKGGQKIHCVVVDDISQTRETVIRTLRFQENIEVDGTAANGLQAVQLVKELKPEVVIMDVNMPDMDGITATTLIKREVPYTQVIILTVQDDVDYIRRAMNAGARDFLAKPPVIEELVAAVERAAEIARREKEKMPPPSALGPVGSAPTKSKGKILTVYSPRGGTGCTTLACNLAAMLRDEETRVVIVDGNLQYGDVAVFFNVQNRTSILDLAPRVDELDIELVNEVLVTHTSGIRILSPSRPERSELVTGPQFSQILTFLSQHFDYVIVDTAHRLNDVTLAALDTSDVIALLTTQDIPSIARMRKFLDLVPGLKLDQKRLLVIMNQFDQRILVDPEKVSQTFNQKIAAVLPMDSAAIINAINQGTPFMLQKDSATRPLGRAFYLASEAVRQRITELAQAPAQ